MEVMRMVVGVVNEMDVCIEILVLRALCSLIA